MRASGDDRGRPSARRVRIALAVACACWLASIAPSRNLLAASDSGRPLLTETDEPLGQHIGPVPLSDEEREWLAEHRRLRVHFEPWPPFLIEEAGRPAGIVVDYFALLSARLGFEIEWVKRPWADAVKAVESGEGVDVLPLLTRDPTRERFLRFTRDYVSFPIVILTRKDESFVGALEDLRGGTIAVERDYAMHRRLARDPRAGSLAVVDTSEEALASVATGRADGYVGNLAVATYLIEHQGFSNLEVAAPSPYGSHDQAAGVRADWPILAGLLDRGLAAVTRHGHAVIRQRWLTVRFEHGVTRDDIQTWVLRVIGAASVLFLFVLLWNRRLRREVDQRRRAERALAEGRSQLLETQAIAGIGRWSFSPDTGRFTPSPEAAAFLGVEATEGTPEAAFAHIEDFARASLLLSLRGAEEAAAPFEVEAAVQAAGGTMRWLVVRGAASPGDEGDPSCPRVVGTVQDITERKAAEERVRRMNDELACANDLLTRAVEDAQRMTEKAQAASVAKSQFLANMSHEIRTPLNGVLGMLTLLGDTALGSAQREYVTMAEGSARSLLGLVEDVLDFSRIEAGKLDLKSAPVAPRDVVAAIEREMAGQTRLKGLTLSTSVDPAVPTQVLGDADRLRQILANLVGNAIKFTERGGVAVRLSRDHSDDARVHLRFTVADTGIGVPSGRLDSLFAPFTQGDASMSRRHGGAGLGLSICRQLAEAMRGRIGVYSTVGRGSTFWFTVALDESAPRADTSLSAASVPATNDDDVLRGARVLVAEDNFVSQRVVLGLLRRFGCVVDVVGDGLQAVAAVSARPYDIVLLDCQMPGMDGYSVARAIRAPSSVAIDPTVPIVALTAHAMSGDRDRCIESGMDDYLTKPVDPGELRSTLRTFLNARARAAAEPAAAPAVDRCFHA